MAPKVKRPLPSAAGLPSSRRAEEAVRNVKSPWACGARAAVDLAVMPEPTSRIYELRLPNLADAGARAAAVGTVLARWAPAAGSPQSLGPTGLVLRLPLGDA